ncbi:MAG: tetratricopeptide repeat protein [Cellvibrionaceae bacterium]
MKKIRWRDNGLFLTLAAILIAGLFVGSEIAIEMIVPTNPTLSINIVNENEIDDEEIVDDSKVLTELDKGQISNISDAIAKEKNANFLMSDLRRDYSGVSDRVWLEIAKQLRKDKKLKHALVLLESLTKKEPNNINILFQLARVRSSLGEPDRAISIYRDLLSIQSSHQLSRMNLGLLLVEKKDFLAASVEFTHAIDITSGRRKAKSLASRGACHIELGKYPEAVLDFEKSIQYRPTDSTVWRKLANAQLLNNDDPKIIRETFDRAIALQPDYLAALHDRAHLRWMNQDFDGARSDLEHISRVAPNFVSSRWTLTYLYLTLDKNQSARKEIQWLRKQGVNDREKIFLMGLENISNKEWDIATENFEQYQLLTLEQAKDLKSIDAGSYQIDQWVTYFSSISDFYGEDKKVDSALNKLDALTPNKWLGTISLLQKSYFLNELKDYAGAIQVLTGLQERFSKSPTIYYWLGRNLLAANDSLKAIEAFRNASKLDKDNSQYKLSLALAYSRAGNISKSVQKYEELLSDHPKHKVGHYNYAVLLNSQGRPEEAIKLYERAIEIDPEYRAAKLNLALLHKKQNNYEEAINWLQDLMDEDPTRQNIRMLMAETWTEQGELEKALDEIERALTLDGEFAEAHILKSTILTKQGDINGAVKELIPLPIEAFSSRINLIRLYNLGVKSLKNEDLELAEACNDKVLSVNPNFEKALVNQSIIYNRSDRHKKTVDLLADKHELLKTNPKMVTGLAKAYQALGDKKKIISLLEPLDKEQLLTPAAQKILNAQL